MLPSFDDGVHGARFKRIILAPTSSAPKLGDGVNAKSGEVGRREKLWGKEEVEKNQKVWVGKDVFLVHPQNGLNDLIFNWCIGG